MDYKLLENELKKRLDFPYSWGRKQVDNFDKETNFIYKSVNFETLLKEIETNFKDTSASTSFKNYALNRWFNFWSAKAVEEFFCKYQSVHPHKNTKDKYVDFFIQHIPFDHKTTIFPKGFKKSIPYAIEHKRELINWFYKNQSKQQRKHFKNRLFIVLINTANEQEHWKLKADLMWLKNIISTYLSTFDVQNLEKFYFQNQIITSDIIWAIK